MNPVDAAAREISAQAAPEDVAAAHEFLAAVAAQGYEAALAGPAAGHLIAKFHINRCLEAITRRIAADHGPPAPQPQEEP